MHQGLICVLSGLAEQVLITANDRFRTQLNMEVLIVLIVLEADAVLTCCYVEVPRVTIDHIDLFIDRIVLLENILLRCVKAGL